MAKEGWAVVEVWHRFAPLVLGIARRTLGSSTDVEDVVQDVFCCVLEKISTLRKPDRLRSFIYGIEKHALKGALRRRRRQRFFTPLSSGAEQPVDSQAADVESRDIERRFDALLTRLAPRDRLIFVLRRVEALPIEEVAAAAQVSNATVKRTVAYASRRLSCWISADPELAALLDGARRRTPVAPVPDLPPGPPPLPPPPPAPFDLAPPAIAITVLTKSASRDVFPRPWPSRSEDRRSHLGKVG
jgi:RNA polymerase sigma-70 factor (ECF subfamily)